MRAGIVGRWSCVQRGPARFELFDREFRHSIADAGARHAPNTSSERRFVARRQILLRHAKANSSSAPPHQLVCAKHTDAPSLMTSFGPEAAGPTEPSTPIWRCPRHTGRGDFPAIKQLWRTPSCKPELDMLPARSQLPGRGNSSIRVPSDQCR